MTKLNEKIYKFLKTKAVSIDEDKKTIRFCVSDNKPDRMGEIVDQSSWDIKGFLANPIALWLHRGHYDAEPEDVIGTWSDFETDDGEGKSYATLHVDADINPKADLIWKQLVKGTLRCVSIGFVPHTLEWLDDDPVLKDNELLEISVVPIPANPRAVALAFKEGSISKKDAQFLMDSMRTEAAFIEQQMSKAGSARNKRKSMTEEQAAKLIESVEGLKQTVTDQGQQITSLVEAKQADDEARTKAEQEATEKAEAEKKAADEEAARKAEEDKEKSDDAAKPGDDDQGGAADVDKFDPDAELTPELQEEIDAALAAADDKKED